MMTTDSAFSDAPAFEAQLRSILRDFDCQTGTLHRTTGDGEFLELVCQIGVPATLLEKISTIPVGKGIAGVAALTREPVELCNLQEDLGGIAKSDARKTGVAGSIAVPILAPGCERVLGTLGIGKQAPHEFSDTEKQRLTVAAADLATQLEA